MMKIAEQYRQFAEEALKKAREATDPQAKREWLTIAKEWTALAEARVSVLNESRSKH